MELPKFNLGENVTWVSQAGGFAKIKVGHVVQVVPSGELPDRLRFGSLFRTFGVGMYRDHESYVVKVFGKFYWPRVRGLFKYHEIPGISEPSPLGALAPDLQAKLGEWLREKSGPRDEAIWALFQKVSNEALLLRRELSSKK